MPTLNPTPEEMQKRIVRAKTIQPKKRRFDQAGGIPAAALESIAADSIYLYMAPGEGVAASSQNPGIVGFPGLTVNLCRCPVGQGPDLHSHARTLETFMFLSGQFEVIWGDDGQCTTVLDEHDMISVPPNVMRAFRNTGKTPEAVLLVLIQGEAKDMATGAIGADLVAKAQADGYTLLLNSSAMVINPWVKKQPFEFRKDLVPVARTADTPYLLTVNPKLPIHNLSEFIDYAKRSPGALMCATYGIGSPPHLALELLKKEAGIDVVHVPYKTFGQALPDLVSGQLSCSIDPPTSPAPQVAAGHIRAVAHTGQAPMEAFPKVDPIGKRYPVATVVGWQAIFAPAATPAPVLSKLRTEWQKTLANPAVMAKLTAAVRNAAQDPSTKAAVFDAGFVPEFVAPAQMGKRIQGDVAKFRKIAADTGIELE